MRRQLLLKLAENSPQTATQLAAIYPISRQGILKHLHILAAADLVSVQQKGREKQYFLTPAPLEDVAVWVQAITAKWDERLLRLKMFLEAENDDIATGVE